MKKYVVNLLSAASVVIILIVVSQYLIKNNRTDNLETQSAKTIITKKDIKPEGNYPNYYWVGKTMQTTTVYKTKEFLIYVTINGIETSHSVSEIDFNKYKVDDKINVDFVEIMFPQKYIIISIS